MLMLGWIRQHFPRVPIVCLMRHPCACAASRIRQGWRLVESEEFLKQEALMTDHLAPYADAIGRAEGAFQRTMIDLCVQNFVPFRQLSKGDVYLAFYENICMDPATELRKIYAFLKKPFDESVLKRLDRPSTTSRKTSAESHRFDRVGSIDGWRKVVSASELSFAQNAMRMFGLDQIYGDRSIADAERAELMWQGRR